MRSARVRLLAVAVLPAVLTLGLVRVAGAQAAGTISVSGVIYRDLNNNGLRDAGEPGVPGIQVHRSAGAGTPAATTAADGSYVLAGLAPASSGSVMVESGWFRSQCAKLTCAAGPGADNDFATANAFIQYPLSTVTTSRTEVNAGLLPDWPGSSAAAPAPVAGVVPSNPVDVASRLSWVSSTCGDGAYLVCRAGDTYTVVSQILNQGTTTLTGITAVLDLPAGDRLATPDPARDLVLVRAATPSSITGLVVDPASPPAGPFTLTLLGSLPPGGQARVTTKAVVTGGPGTPGCVPAALTSACPQGEPQGAPLTLAVTHLDQGPDPDSFGPGCLVVSVTACPTGIHDKQVEPDEVDPVGHNVDARLAPAAGYDLRGGLAALAPRAPETAAPGAPVTWRAWAANDGPVTALPGWTLTVLLPLDSAPAVPAASAVMSCVKGTSASGFPYVRCTGKGPLSPGVSSFAVDVAARVPASAQPGSLLPALAYVQPAAGQAGEAVPLGVPATSPATGAATTPTNNDASATLPVA